MEGLPVMFWGLDPLYWTHIKLFAIEILKLPPYPGFQGVFAVSNHPIFRAHLMGYVVSVDRRQKLTIYGGTVSERNGRKIVWDFRIRKMTTVQRPDTILKYGREVVLKQLFEEFDDGTATIPCCHWIDQDGVPENSQQLNLGDLVSALGKITTFRDRRQITIESICIERDPNSEALHWLEVLKHKELYNKPFEVPVKFNPKAPTTNKHWLHMTPLDGEINELEEEVQKNISDYLESANILSFFIDNLCTVSQLKGKAKLLSSKYDERLKEKYGSDALRDHLKKNASKNATKTIIRPLLRKLEKKGIVYCKNVFNGNFDFISVNEDLAPRILDVIRDVSETEGETSYGVSRSKIIQKLKSLEKYKCVKRDNIISALDNLLASGDIYETKDYHYRLI